MHPKVRYSFLTQFSLIQGPDIQQLHIFILEILHLIDCYVSTISYAWLHFFVGFAGGGVDLSPFEESCVTLFPATPTWIKSLSSLPQILTIIKTAINLSYQLFAILFGWFGLFIKKTCIFKQTHGLSFFKFFDLEIWFLLIYK